MLINLVGFDEGIRAGAELLLARPEINLSVVVLGGPDCMHFCADSERCQETNLHDLRMTSRAS